MISKIILKDSIKQSLITNPQELLPILNKIKDEWQEHLIIIPLDSANHPLGCEVVAIGIENQVPLNPRIVFKKIFSEKKYLKAVSFIMSHNHPSGSSIPSEEDYSITKVISAASKIMDFPLLDHIVISRKGLNSIRRNRPEVFAE